MDKGELSIRTIEEEDLEKIHIWNSTEFRGDYQECELSSLHKMKKRFAENSFFTDEFQMLMVTNKNERVGMVYLNFIRTGFVKIGIVLDSSNRYKGIGTDVTRMICDYLFDNYQVKRIEADTDAENVAAQRVLEKAGFKQEGRLEAYRFHHGKYNDSLIYGLVK